MTKIVSFLNSVITIFQDFMAVLSQRGIPPIVPWSPGGDWLSNIIFAIIIGIPILFFLLLLLAGLVIIIIAVFGAVFRIPWGIRSVFKLIFREDPRAKHIKDARFAFRYRLRNTLEIELKELNVEQMDSLVAEIDKKLDLEKYFVVEFFDPYSQSVEIKFQNPQDYDTCEIIVRYDDKVFFDEVLSLKKYRM